MSNEKLEALKQMKADYLAKMQADGKTAVSAVLSDFFKANPKAEAVRWTQYTPYFNDGDTCEFSVHDPYVKVEGIDDDGDYDDGFLSEWDSKLPADVKDGFKALSSDLGGIDDVLETVFGDHAQVTCARDGSIEVDSYEHD